MNLLHSDLYLIERIWSRTRQENGCWLYEPPYGVSEVYSHISLGRNNVRDTVHRISVRIFHNMILENGLEANHKLECPNKNCWCPDHLYAGTQSDNTKDRVTLNTHCPNGHEYSLDNTALYQKYNTIVRRCKICIRISRNKAAKKFRDKGNK